MDSCIRALIYYIYVIIGFFWVKKLQEERSVKWILVISLIMIPVSTMMGTLMYPYYSYYYSARQPDALEALSFYINRVDILFFIATMTIAALSTTGFGSKALLSRLAIYLFLISMALFSVSVLRLLFTPPWTAR